MVVKGIKMKRAGVSHFRDHCMRNAALKEELIKPFLGINHLIKYNLAGQLVTGT